MIDCQLRPNEVNDERIIDAITNVPRDAFVPKAKRSVAYVDEDLEIAPGRFLMEPRVFGRLLMAADVQQSDIVLDVGCATGYSTAVLAGLADAVVAVEEDEKLAASAEKKLAGLDVMNAAVVTCTMCNGVAKQGPFDVIFIEGAVEEIPAVLLKQLKEGGRLVCVKVEGGVGRAHMISKVDGKFEGQNLFDADVPAIPGFEKKRNFAF
jgi:protein-L-isoaspartate(D-aspartate) O-methyltransferase